MPVPRRALTGADVLRFIDEQCFPAGPGRVGAELEWFATAPHAVVAACLAGELPGGSTITFEPGGQVELSSPAGTLASVCAALTTDVSAVQAALAPAGASLVGVGVHPSRSPSRVLSLPRYEAMERYWASGGEHDPGAGRAMMCTTAAVQVSVDASEERAGSRDERWRLAHALSPVLAASFANSPVAQDRVTGWRSTRLGIWEGLDPTRTAPACRSGRAVDDWASYVLHANVMLIRTPDGYRPVAPGLPFGRWMALGHELGWPDVDDLAYHVSTLFPPVRARGWLELRSVDALPEPWWPVPVAVCTALMDDPAAAAAAVEVTERAAWCWCEAPRWSLAYPVLAEAARACFGLAASALERLGAPPALRALVDAYRERFVERGRCPADDTLDALARAGAPAVVTLS